MDGESVIYLDYIKNSFYEKGLDLVSVNIYVRDVDDNEVLFEEDKVTVKFSTSHQAFLKQHGQKGTGKQSFCYSFNTRESINCSECYYKVKAPFIDITLKKKVPQKWKSLFRLEMSDSSCSTNNLTSDGKKKKKSPKKSQLLGGKSTLKKLNDDKKQDADVKMDNVATSSKSEDERNIKKAVASQPEQLAGLTGLENYANNCYMNVVIQILANIQETRDYFKNDHYLKDINANNPLSSGGKVAKAFADVTKALWSFRKNAFKPTALKNIMGKRYSLFLGWQQHDAQEFFASLLDNLHEDINQSNFEKCNEKESNKVDTDTSINEKPETAWFAHLKRNNSFIVKLFHGQLMSKLTCGACHKVSYSYDPCAQISLPILSTKQLLKILFFTCDTNRPPLLVTIQISTPNAKVWHLINMLQTIVKVPPHLISLFTGISNVCVDEQAPLLSVRKYKYVIASEVSSKDEVEFFSIAVYQYVLHKSKLVLCDNCFVLESETVKLKRCTRCLSVAYCSHECQAKHWQMHNKVCSKEVKMQVGLPFYLTLRKDSLTFETLEQSMRDRAKFSVEVHSCISSDEKTKNDNSEDTAELEKRTKRLSLTTAPCVIKVSNKPVNDDMCVVVNNENYSEDVITKASCLILEWQNCVEEEKDSGYDVRTKAEPIHEVLETDNSTGITEEEHCSVYDCLRLFMEPESLDEQESWKCPKCKSLQSAKKEMAISSPPGLLLLHLKRFTYGEYGQKINKPVSYPLNNFDLTPFIAKETRSKIENPLVYDLCGVITHRGTMRMGHYTCIVRMLGQHDQEEIGWRFFDDDAVTKIKSDKVVSADAYVLVYRMRGTREKLRLENYLSENSVKRKPADAVAASAYLNTEKVAGAAANFNPEKTNCSDHLNGYELDMNAIKTPANSDYFSDENICGLHNITAMPSRFPDDKVFTEVDLPHVNSESHNAIPSNVDLDCEKSNEGNSSTDKSKPENENVFAYIDTSHQNISSKNNFGDSQPDLLNCDSMKCPEDSGAEDMITPPSVSMEKPMNEDSIADYNVPLQSCVDDYQRLNIADERNADPFTYAGASNGNSEIFNKSREDIAEDDLD